MLKIENTPNLAGIKIIGDYNDLNTLYDAISRYTELFYTNAINQVELQSKEENWDDEEKSFSIRYYSEMQDCILGLNYDIRHAWQGDRNYEYVENHAEGIGRLAECIFEVDHDELDNVRETGANGNLYFSVEILYPWALYYLQCFNVMTDAFYSKEDRSRLYNTYTELEYRKDTSILEYFSYSIWDCLLETLGLQAERMMDLADFAVEQPFGTPLYYEALCSYYCDINKKDNDLRKSMLQMIFYESLGTEWMEDGYIDSKLMQDCQKDIQNAEKLIRENTEEGFLSFPEYIEREMAYFRDHDYTYDEKENFISSFGEVDWMNVDW